MAAGLTSWISRFDEPSLAPGHGLGEGDWVRGPLRISTIQSALLSVTLPALGGLWTIAGLNTVTTLLLLLAIYFGDTRGRGFRWSLQAVNTCTLFSLYYSVFVAGFNGSLILYYAPLVLLGAAHMLGARWAVAWAVPCFALSVASEFSCMAGSASADPFVSILTEGGLVITMLAYAVSLRRAYDNKAAQLERLATTDPLTGLANRLELQLGVRHALSRAERFGRHGALVFIDLDGMKRVNDEHGHDAGDRLLCEIATRIRKLTRGIDVAARLGGDEFVVLLSEYEDPKGAEIFARKVLASLQAPLAAGNSAITAGASLGFVEFPRIAGTTDLLLARADEAMYAAKRAGGGRIFRAQANGVAEVI